MTEIKQRPPLPPLILDDGQLEGVLQILRNVGVDTDCGACCEIAFTGMTTSAHTCAGRAPLPTVTR